MTRDEKLESARIKGGEIVKSLMNETGVDAMIILELVVSFIIAELTERDRASMLVACDTFHARMKRILEVDEYGPH